MSGKLWYNIRNSELPWYKTLLAVALNFWRRAGGEGRVSAAATGVIRAADSDGACRSFRRWGRVRKGKVFGCIIGRAREAAKVGGEDSYERDIRGSGGVD